MEESDGQDNLKAVLEVVKGSKGNYGLWNVRPGSNS